MELIWLTQNPANIHASVSASGVPGLEYGWCVGGGCGWVQSIQLRSPVYLIYLFPSVIKKDFLKVQFQIRQIQHILYGIPSLWSPYCEKLYQITNSFINHVNQTDLGISLWGFAVVTKPLLLTVFILTKLIAKRVLDHVPNPYLSHVSTSNKRWKLGEIKCGTLFFYILCF